MGQESSTLKLGVGNLYSKVALICGVQIPCVSILCPILERYMLILSCPAFED